MVGAWQPKNFFAIHPRFAREDILDGIIEDMPHMEHARDVRGRDYNGVGGLRGFRISDKTILVQPKGIPLGFDSLGFVGFWYFSHGNLTTDTHG
jgi:hypothetical protein